jgi:hypothetical protein
MDTPTEMTLTLFKPVQLTDAAEPVRELYLTEPTAEQLAAAGAASGVQSNILLIAAVAKQPAGLIGKLCARDYAKAANFLLGFLNPDQQTGGN